VLIDRLAGLRSANQLRQVPQPAGGSPAFAPAIWQDADGRHWQELDLSLLARHEQYLAIAA
jgi:twitching motility protein PilI